MTNQELARVAACIIVLGHLGLFAYAFVVLMLQRSYLDGAETLHLVLMGSPLFVLVAHSAAEYVLRNRPTRECKPAATPQIILVLTVPTVALIALVVVYSLAIFRPSRT